VLTGEPALPATTWRLKSHLLRTRNLPTDRIRNYYSGSTLVAMPPKITAGDRTGSSTLNYMLGDHPSLSLGTGPSLSLGTGPSLSLGTGLGSTAITTDSNGGYFAEIRYYPWGTERYTYGTTPTHPSLCSGQAYHFTSESIKTVKACRHCRHCRRAEAGEWDRIVLLRGKIIVTRTSDRQSVALDNDAGRKHGRNLAVIFYGIIAPAD
jgi:hypothetical protein